MDRVRRGWALGMAAGIALGLACGPQAFTCSDDAQCRGGPAGGVCAQGHCAFPADECDSDLRWGEHAGQLAGACVPAARETEASASTSTGPGEGSSGASLGASEEGVLDTSGEVGSDGPLQGAVEFRDDELQGEFGAGTLQDVEWTGERLTLGPGATQGTFTSRVYDADTTVQWQTVQWMPDAPYGKPLPDGGAAERGYRSGGVNMDGNVLLMHMDGEGVWNDGVDVLDASGAASHGRLLSSGGPVALVPGVFGTAIDDHEASRISIPTSDAPALAFGTADFTWSLWFRMDDPCLTNHVYMGVDDSEDAPNLGPHLWLGCTDDPWDAQGCAGRGVRGGGVLRSEHATPDDGGYYCTQTDIGGDQWHHLLMVKEGHDAAVLRLWLDGVLEHESEVGFVAPIEYPNEPDFTIGAFSRDAYRAVGVFDEVAIWARALPEAEVQAVYQRGATALRVLVRACELPECADDPPFGSALLDPPRAAGPGSEVPLPELPVGRYAQYRVEMSGGRGAARPALSFVTVRGLRL